MKIVPTIEELCQQVDAVLLMSVDGRPHLEQAKPVIKAGKPMFIDKPVAGSLRDAIEIFRLAKEAKVPVFSSSSYRYYDSLVEVKKANVGEIRSVISYGPAHLEPHHPDLFWYGVHPTEALFTMLGTGCETVSRTTTPDTDIISGIWSGGRIGTYRGIREHTHQTGFGASIFGMKSIQQIQVPSDYGPLLVEIAKFFKTRQPPVSDDVTLEIFAFIEAADESKRLGGAPVTLAAVVEKARQAR